MTVNVWFSSETMSQDGFENWIWFHIIECIKLKNCTETGFSSAKANMVEGAGERKDYWDIFCDWQSNRFNMLLWIYYIQSSSLTTPQGLDYCNTVMVIQLLWHVWPGSDAPCSDGEPFIRAGTQPASSSSLPRRNCETVTTERQSLSLHSTSQPSIHSNTKCLDILSTVL